MNIVPAAAPIFLDGGESAVRRLTRMTAKSSEGQVHSQESSQNHRGTLNMI